MNAPLVSCVMPTANRRAFVPQAIRCFLNQDYAPRELLVVDDGVDAIADLLPGDERIRYIRLETPLSIGPKRNYACEMAHGDVIVHWDDDDWSAPWRVSVQVNALLRTGADACGLSRLWFYDPLDRRAWEYRYPEDERRWVAGGTLCYRRDLWRGSPFPDVATGEDTSFVWTLDPLRVLPLADNRFYVATVHARNTSPRQLADPRFVPAAPDVVESLLGADLAALAAACAPRPPSPPAPETTVRLNLGYEDVPLPDYVNVHIVGGAGVQVVDLRQRWPWTDSSVDHVRAWDVIEHLPDKIFTMNELWRVLRPGGTAEIAVPTTDGTGAFQDPTHVSFWNRRSFLYYEAGNPYRERFAASYGITAKFSVLAERMEQSVDGPRLTILLRAVKASREWRVVILSARAENLVPCVRALLDQEPALRPEHIIVVDDGVRGEGEGLLPPVTWVAGAKPFVFARNANIGIRAAGTADVLLLNDDARLVTAGGISQMAAQMGGRTDIGLCSAAVQGVVGNPRQLPAGTGTIRLESDALAFVAVFIPRHVYQRLGPLDERFVGYGWEDNDYCARARAAGLACGVADVCVVDHSGDLQSTFRTRADVWDQYEINRRLYSGERP